MTEQQQQIQINAELMEELLFLRSMRERYENSLNELRQHRELQEERFKAAADRRMMADIERRRIERNQEQQQK